MGRDAEIDEHNRKVRVVVADAGIAAYLQGKRTDPGRRSEIQISTQGSTNVSLVRCMASNDFDVPLSHAHHDVFTS